MFDVTSFHTWGKYGYVKQSKGVFMEMSAKERLDIFLKIKYGVEEEGHPVPSACAKFGVTESWYYRWKPRFDKAVEQALADKPPPEKPYIVQNSPQLLREIASLENRVSEVKDTTYEIQKSVRQIKKRLSDGTV